MSALGSRRRAIRMVMACTLRTLADQVGRARRLHALRYDRLKRRGGPLGRGEMRRMAGVDFMVAPSGFALGALGEGAESAPGRDTLEKNVASRQRDIGPAQP